jgi:DNA topoisomerase-1
MPTVVRSSRLPIRRLGNQRPFRYVDKHDLEVDNDTATRIHPAFREERELAKFDRLLEFAEKLPEMRRITGQHLRRRKLDRQKVLAAMVRLIDSAYFRVGNDQYAKENQTYGLTTMRSKHLTVDGDRLIFDYTGKSGKEHHQEIVDARLTKIVSELDELPGYEIFKYFDDSGKLIDVKSDDLNAYIKEIMGEDFSAKDFRTWAGTLIAAVALAEAEKCETPTALKRSVTTAVKHVSEHLGNTPAIARASYIDPRVIDHYLSGVTIKSYLRQIKRLLENPENEHFSREEIAVLKLLRRRLTKKKD